MSIAKAIFGVIGTGLVGLLLTFVAIREWALWNLENHFWQTLFGFAVSAAFGVCAALLVHGAYIRKRLGDDPARAFDRLRRVPELEDCDGLGDMVAPVRLLAERPTAEELARLDGEVGALRRSLGVAERNATAALAEVGESLDDVAIAQELLSTLHDARNARAIGRVVDERVNVGSEADNARYGRALERLVRYGCLSGVECLVALPEMRYRATVGEGASVTRRDFPSLGERTRVDLLAEAEAMVDGKLRDMERKWFG